MNYIADFGQESFDSECQNDPQEATGPMDLLSVHDIMRKTNGVPATIIPLDCTKVVSFIDVHDRILDYEVWAYDRHFGGAKILGGTWPHQKMHLFNHADPPRPLSTLYPGMTTVAAVCMGLDDLLEHLLGREWVREDDAVMSIRRCLVDANGTHSDDIKKACRASRFRSIITPSYGMGITAKKIPISKLITHKGRKDIGPEWAPKKSGPGEIPCVIFDANFWKTRFHSQLSMPRGEHGALVLHEADGEIHRRSAEGYRGEKPVEVTANGRTVREWSPIPNRENHPFDCAVGCMVAASMEGVTTTGAKPSNTRRKRKVRYA
jgi:phage terminase large subunit GpA-like protein